MKKFLILFAALLSLFCFAEEKKKQEGTEHSFEDLLVQGQYHFSDAAVTTVEEDKVLDSLLGVRTDFQDRIEQSSGRW